MKLRFQQEHLSIKKFKDVDIPNLTILTGVNGSGKTHLLEAIEQGKVIVDGFESSSIAYFNYETFKMDNESSFNAQNNFAEKNEAWTFFDQNIKNGISSIKGVLGTDYHRLFSLCEKDKKNLWDLTEEDIRDEQIFRKFINFKRDTKDFFNNNYKDNYQAQGIFYLAKRIQHSLDEIDKDTFLSLYRPVHLKNGFLPQQLGKVIWDYYVEFRNNEVNEYQNDKYGKNYPFVSWEEFENRHGEKPWNVVNRILERFSSLDYKITSPEGFDYFGNYQIKLTHSKNEDIQINFENLSSGERVLMALVASIYKSSADNHFPDILLLDEIDASLHPSMIENLFDVIRDVFLEKDVAVILVTHSPTTVAIAPEKSIFVMNRDGENRIVESTRSEALEILTDGFVTLDKGIKLFDQISRKKISIITEGNNSKYLEKACDLFGMSSEVAIVSGAEGKSGDTQLKVLFDFFSKIDHENDVLFVWDCDAIENKKIKGLMGANKTVPIIFDKNEENKKVSVGIENLFPENLFEQRFYSHKEKETSYGEKIQQEEFDKNKFQEFILKEGKREWFDKFDQLFEKIREIIDK